VRESFEAYAFDALMRLADTGGSEPNTKTPAIRHLGLIRVDLEALLRGRVDGDEVCEIAGLGPVPVARARALLGESVLKLVFTNGVAVVNVTHLGRAATVAQKAALLWTHPTCTRDSCGRGKRLEVDHRIDWADTHHTVLGELAHLCSFDHYLKTVLGWALVDGEGPRAMVPPDHPDHPDNKDRAPPEEQAG